MTTILDTAIKAANEDDAIRSHQRGQKVLQYAHIYFGDYADTLTLCDDGALAIPNSAWRLHLGCGNNFFLFHRDHMFGDTKYCGWGIVDLASLGRAYQAVVKSHGDQ